MSNKKFYKPFYYVFFLALIAVPLFLSSCNRGTVEANTGATWAADREEEPAMAVEALTVSRGKLIPFVEANGVISGSREAYVVAETQGVIRTVEFEIGDLLTEGQLLLQVSDSITRLNLEQAKQQYDLAQVDLSAAERFFAQGSASQIELSRARAAFNGAKAVLEAAQKANNDTALKAPISGAVAWKDPGIAPGNYLVPGSRVARVVDMQELRILLSVGERQVGLLERGSKAVITVPTACSGTEIAGVVAAIAAGSDLSTGSYAVIVTAPNTCPDVIKAGMSARVRIFTREEPDRLIIPTASLVTRENREYLFVEDNGKALPVEIKTRITMGNRTALDYSSFADPGTVLSEGDTVILSGLSGLRPGKAISAKIIGTSGEWK